MDDIRIKPTWHFIVKFGGPKIWALYTHEQNKRTMFDPDNFDSPLMGFIERRENGTWDCFAMDFIGNEPNKEYAMDLVYKAVTKMKFLDRIASL